MWAIGGRANGRVVSQVGISDGQEALVALGLAGLQRSGLPPRGYEIAQMAREWLPQIRELCEAGDVSGLVGQLGAGFHETGDARDALALIGADAMGGLIAALESPSPRYASTPLWHSATSATRPPYRRS